MLLVPTENELNKSLQKGSNKGQYLISLSYELLADLETPVSTFYKICDKKPYSFLLESVEGGEKLGRYSLIGTEPLLIFTSKANQIILENTSDKKTIIFNESPFEAFKKVMNNIQTVDCCDNNFMGFVGYFGYENVSWIEPKIKLQNYKNAPDICLTLPGKMVIFDHVLHKVNLIINILSKNKDCIPTDYAQGKEKLKSFVKEFSTAKTSQQLPINYHNTVEAKYESNYSESEFIDMVNLAKEHIIKGDIFQVVLSQKLKLEKHFEGFMLYRALRSINPSPYLFYLNFLGYEIAGSSPEVMVKCENINSQRIASLRPIAGTYHRGQTETEDKKQIVNLLNDPKERAEHLMLVDLARNDLGRVCKAGSIQTPELMVIEKYSHVLHMVSQVEGILKEDKTSIDLLTACFPAGTLSGAPKIRAMEIINELEKDTRGPYAGCIGFYGLNDTINTCMTIRTFVIYKNHIEIQAGAGIVADSEPKSEYLETLRKGAALLKAVSMLKQ